MLEHLQRLILDTSTFDATLRAYETLLATRPVLAHEPAAQASRHAFFHVGNTTLEVRSTASTDTASGLAALVFQAQDVDATHQALDASGLADAPRSRHELSADNATPQPFIWHQFPLVPEATGDIPIHIADADAGGLWTRDPDEAQSPPAGGVIGLDHVVIRSRDADATRNFYGDQLGIRVAVDREFPQWGVRLIFCKVGDLTLEIASRIGSDDAKSPLDSQGDNAPSTRDSLWGCSWRVADADEARGRLAGAGLDVSEVRKGRRPGTRVFTVRNGTAGVPTLMIEPPDRPNG